MAEALLSAAGPGESKPVASGDRVARTPEPPGGENLFHREGEYWTLGYEGRVVRVRDAKGLRDIAVLLASPGREIHVADLIAATEPPRPMPGEESFRA
jgi:hypothetical protein